MSFEHMQKIINLIKTYVPLDILREVILELDRLDTAARRDIVRSARELGVLK